VSEGADLSRVKTKGTSETFVCSRLARTSTSQVTHQMTWTGVELSEVNHGIINESNVSLTMTTATIHVDGLIPRTSQSSDRPLRLLILTLRSLSDIVFG
jgi:hypothetical protein